MNSKALFKAAGIAGRAARVIGAASQVLLAASFAALAGGIIMFCAQAAGGKKLK